MVRVLMRRRSLSLGDSQSTSVAFSSLPSGKLDVTFKRQASNSDLAHLFFLKMSVADIFVAKQEYLQAAETGRKPGKCWEENLA